MDRRLKFQTLLESIMAAASKPPNVYFQPDDDIHLEYPVIVYRRDYADAKHANNVAYSFEQRYMVTYIDRDPDGAINQELIRIPKSSFDRFYISDGLNHDVFKIYF